MYSFVIKIAIDVNRAVEIVDTLQMLGFINDNVDVAFVHPDPSKISVIINSNLFFLKICTSSHNNHYQF